MHFFFYNFANFDYLVNFVNLVNLANFYHWANLANLTISANLDNLVNLIQGATRIPPSGCGIAAGYGSCICLRSVIFLVLCWLLGCYAMSLLTNSFESSGCLLSGRFGGREYWYRRREDDDRIIINYQGIVWKWYQHVLKLYQNVWKWCRNGVEMEHGGSRGAQARQW